MKTMDLKKVDVLHPDQLEIGDLIGYQGNIVEVNSIESNDGLTYFVEYTDDYGDTDTAVVMHDEMLDWYYYIDEE
jgi:hypothetical protein